MITIHLSCKEHPFQDRKYGYKRRVCNPKKGYPLTTTTVICTVCGEAFSTTPETKKKKKR